MQKFSQFYVTYRNIVQFDHDLGKLDYFEKSVLKLMAGPVHPSRYQSALVFWLRKLTFVEEKMTTGKHHKSVFSVSH